MSTEKYANNPNTTLNGAINGVVTTLTFTDASTFPVSGQFRILIDTEIIIVGTLVGNVGSNLIRGAENTTAAAHLNAAAIKHIITAGSIVNNPRSMTTAGDIEYLGSTGAPTRLAAPADGDYVVTFATAVPSWKSFAALSGISTGTIMMYGGAAAPSGYFICDGAAKNRVTEAALFAIIGTTYGAGDGATTFNLPDLRQCFPLGKAAAGTGSTLGGRGGTIDHTHAVPSLTIPVRDIVTGGSASSFLGLNNNELAWHVNSPGYVSASYTSSPISPTEYWGSAAGVTGTGTTDAKNPPYVVVNFIIKN